MPLPVPDTCSYPGDRLYLLGDINGDNNYFVGSTFNCDIGYSYDINSPGGGGNGRLTSNQPVQLFNSSTSKNEQGTHTITTDTNPLLITRLGPSSSSLGMRRLIYSDIVE